MEHSCWTTLTTQNNESKGGCRRRVQVSTLDARGYLPEPKEKVLFFKTHPLKTPS